MSMYQHFLMSNICLHTGQVSWPPSNHRRTHRSPRTCPQGSLTGRSRSNFLTHVELALTWGYGSRQIAQVACSEEIGSSGSPLKKAETSCLAGRDLPIAINISAAVRISSLHLTWFVDDIVFEIWLFRFPRSRFCRAFSCSPA